MKKSLIIIGAMLFGTAALLAHGHHQPPLKSEAVEAIKRGEFELASQLFVKEIEANPAEARLKQLYTELKTQMRREKLLADEQDCEMIVRIGREMRKFYYRFGLFDKAEAIDRKIYAAEPSLQNGVALGVTLLNRDNDREAAEVFGKLDLGGAKPAQRLCAALAFARVGEQEKAKKLLAECDPGQLDENGLQLYARCAGRCGDAVTAAALAKKLLENSPDKKHPSLKKHLFAARDFEPVAKSDAFRAALETASKVEDDCDDCPNRGTDQCDHHGKK